MMPTLNYTTGIPAVRTIAEIQDALARHGASAVAVNYADREACGISFQLPTPHGTRTFTLPVDIDAVWRLLIDQHERGIIRPTGGKRDRFKTREHAARVAWRVLKDWVTAQLAIIEAQMVTFDQVMLPYLHVDGSLTLYDVYRDHELRALTAGEA